MKPQGKQKEEKNISRIETLCFHAFALYDFGTEFTQLPVNLIFICLLLVNKTSEPLLLLPLSRYVIRYGHPACCVNFTVPLTTPPPAAALHVESAPGQEVYKCVCFGVNLSTKWCKLRNIKHMAYLYKISALLVSVPIVNV